MQKKRQEGLGCSRAEHDFLSGCHQNPGSTHPVWYTDEIRFSWAFQGFYRNAMNLRTFSQHLVRKTNRNLIQVRKDLEAAKTGTCKKPEAVKPAMKTKRRFEDLKVKPSPQCKTQLLCAKHLDWNEMARRACESRGFHCGYMYSLR